MGDFVGALDQGTTSTRFMLFDVSGDVVGVEQLEHEQILPRPGWVEHDPVEIWQRCLTVIVRALDRVRLTWRDLDSIGVANQRETTVVWDRRTGRPYYNALVWQDTRTDSIAATLDRSAAGELIRRRAGVPPAAYFSGGKLQWLLENVPGLRQDAEAGHALFGTIDTWLLWNLTGGPSGGVHVTDPTNASRTMLMDLRSLAWDPELLSLFQVPARMLPAICPSSNPSLFGVTHPAGPLGGEVRLSAALGDQHSATVGHQCFTPAQAKNTYGTGNFVLLNTGSDIVTSENGLLTTVAYQLGDEPPVYALEGSVAVTGSAVQWLRDQLGIIADVAESEELARAVASTEGLYFVPAFSGLFAPHWRPDARGVLVGMSRFHGREHVARAALEAICYQSLDVLTAMEGDSGHALEVMYVDGGVTANEFAMQLQADILGLPVVRPAVIETTALGAAFAAGLATGFWPDREALAPLRSGDRRWDPTWSEERRQEGHHDWTRAVQRSLGWIEATA